ncbi:MAG TPA: hypothetical protein VF792_08860 [Ktedonobacterales bacterium]
MTTTSPLTGCSLGLSSDDLSAWRDNVLDAAANARMTAHITTCDACQTHIAAYDAIAQGLRAIPTPAPPGGYGRNPRLHAATRRARHSALRTRRARHPALRATRALSGLGAIAAVILLTLAFTQVFGLLGGQKPRPAATATLAPYPTATATNTPAPTVTPVEPILPALQFEHADAAWGATGLVAHIAATQTSDGQTFVPTDLLPDGSALLGSVYTGNPSNNAQMAEWNLSTNAVTKFNVSILTGNSGTTDGRYVAYPSGDGAAIYDLSAGTVTQQLRFGVHATPSIFDHGIYLRQDLMGSITKFNVATGQGTPFPDASMQYQHAQLLAFSWPYVVYSYDPNWLTPQPGVQSGRIDVRDLSTGQDVNLTALQRLMPDLNTRLGMQHMSGVAVTNGALFFVTAPDKYTNQLYELDNFMSATPALKPLFSFKSQYQCEDCIILWGANARTAGLELAGGPLAIYDRALGKAVEINQPGLYSEVKGNYAYVFGPVNGHAMIDPASVTIYDTTRLPGG